MALVFVLAALALMGALAASFLADLRLAARLAHHDAGAAAAEAIADAGIAWAIDALLTTEAPAPVLRDGSPNRRELAAGRFEVRITDANGKVDLNAAGDELLKGLFRAAGLDPDAADALGDAVADWRDPDDAARLNGAEEPVYLGLGLEGLPANRPFRSVDELRQVAGMNEALFRRLRPAVTVFAAQDGTINPFHAPRLALDAIPESDAAEIDQLLEIRARNADALPENREPLPPFASGGAYVTAFQGAILEISSLGISPTGSRTVREAVVWLTGDEEVPYRLLARGRLRAEPNASDEGAP